MKQKLSEDDLHKVLKGIADFLYNIEDVQRFLQKSFDAMLEQKTGASITLLGPPGSGKRSVVRRFAHAQKGEINLIEHNANLDDMISAKERLRQLEELLDQDSKVCYVIYNFEKFKGTFGNNVLYTLAQRVRSSPLLLILVGESQKGLSVFEKRIASRLSSNSLRMIPNKTPEKCWEFFTEMLNFATTDLSKTTRKLFKLPTEIPINFYRICRLNPIYGALKLLAKDLVDTYYDSEGALEISDIILDLIKERLSVDPYKELADQITDRQYGLLMAAAIKTERVHLYFPSRYLFSEYKRFINQKGIPERSILYLTEKNFDSDLRELIGMKFFGAKYQGNRIIMICWNLNPLPLFEPHIKDKFLSKFSNYIEERADPNFKNLRM
ncbi:unnamed protein product [Bursaphelenchus xylophilus]|uniref:(pine wood nematode) hypothetical protein n=1 Tax=Bursaphelenchus xylophilus TaxID=6326 RepID=A0A1I7RWG0_BURXY|nr:unnamed protein product [Bursaphelenchus xylophilus]CAG9128343.1 unnamed protein product [Bursaphelenchus xylophilus]